MPPRAPTNLVKPTRAGARAAAGELDSRMYELDMNQTALAKASDVTIGSIRKLLVGQFANSYRPDKLRALSLALRWQPDRLANLLTKATEQPGLGEEQLERIERKLDELLERFEALGRALSPKT